MGAALDGRRGSATRGRWGAWHRRLRHVVTAGAVAWALVVAVVKGQGRTTEQTAPQAVPVSPSTSRPEPQPTETGTDRPRPRPASPRPARPPSPTVQLATDIRALIAGDGVKRGSWGVLVHSLDRKQRLIDINAQALFVPASTAKLVSAAAAWETVGWEHRFDTTVWATGPVVDGVLQGDLVVVGSGDPSIGSRGWPGLDTWSGLLKEQGVTRVSGRIVGDDDAVEEPRPSLAWGWDDLGYTAGAMFGALNVGENRMTVTVSPGPVAGAPAQLSVDPAAEHRALVNRTETTAAKATFLWPEQRPAETALTIAGTIRPGAKPARVAVSAGNPTRWFAGVLKHHLTTGGIAVDGDAVDIDDIDPRPTREGATLLFTHRSPPLRDLVRPMLKDSLNLYGEALLRLAAGPNAFPTNDNALAGLKTLFTSWGVSEDAQQIIDGSGMSRRDAISPEALLAVLQRMYDPEGMSPFMQALPIAGVDGSLANRMRDTLAAMNVRAKTGTMSNIRTLAGYVTTLDGEHLAFVVMANNFEGTGAQALAAIDAVAVRLASFTRKPIVVN